MKRKWKGVIMAAGILLAATAGEAGAASLAGTPEGYDRAQAAEAGYSALYGKSPMALEKEDPEFAGMMKKYIYGDIRTQSVLPLRDQELTTLAVLTATHHPEWVEKEVSGALQGGVSPMDIREAIYQTAPYTGFPDALASLKEADKAFKKAGVKLPLEGKAVTNDADRLDKGVDFQVGTYGERIRRMREEAPANQKALQDDLSAFCFGDIYTRDSLDLRTREMITVAVIGAMGIEPQFKSHVAGALAAGMSQDEVIGTITIMNPYVGFPKTLNALRWAKEVFDRNRGQA
ncbi:carboxymuconolactone decarboxylase family protein [Dialister sp.]|uniref:carboxymuconolactone decarboxylase family protein n=1 Tax=Dialister sp. TaxID=1955814 RepID=UPI003EFD335C